MTALPVSKEFYNWRNKDKENIENFKNMLNQPVQYIYNMSEDIYWCEDWGEEPENEKELRIYILQKEDI